MLLQILPLAGHTLRVASLGQTRRFVICVCGLLVRASK
jgi:hypothetical protein